MSVGQDCLNCGKRAGCLLPGCNGEYWETDRNTEYIERKKREGGNDDV